MSPFLDLFFFACSLILLGQIHASSDLEESYSRNVWTPGDKIQSVGSVDLEDKLKRMENQMQRQSEKIDELSQQVNWQTKVIRKQSKELHRLNEERHTISEKETSSDNSFLRHLRFDDINAWEPVVSQLSGQVDSMAASIQALTNQVTDINQNMGTTYTRWGNDECPSTAQLVYAGYVGGSWFDQTGAAVNYLCLPHEPVFNDHKIPPVISSHNHVQELYGAEYQAFTEDIHDRLPLCAVCRSVKASTVMVPSTDACSPGWTREYQGYLMAGGTLHAAGSEFICVDGAEQFAQGTSANQDGKLLYYTVTRCGSLPCPPYATNKIVQCVVCSK